MSEETYNRNRPRSTNSKISPILIWALTLASLVILAIGLWLQSPWWMLSIPVAIAGAIVAGMSRKFFPMIICIAVVALFVVVMRVFAP